MEGRLRSDFRKNQPDKGPRSESSCFDGREGRQSPERRIMQPRILAARLNICRQVVRLGHAPWLGPFVHPRAST